MRACPDCGLSVLDDALECVHCGAQVPEVERERSLGGYVIEKEISRGGMGVVYLARDEAVGRSVALKVIAPALAADRGFRERFRRESRLAAQVEHPAVVPVYR